MRTVTVRRCVGAILLVVLPFQSAGCAVSTYDYESHPLPGQPLDTLAIRQLFGESVRVTLRSGTTLHLRDASLEGDTLWGTGMRVPLDSVAQVDIARSDPTRAVKTSQAAAAASGVAASAALTAVVVVGVVVGLGLLVKAIGDELGRSQTAAPAIGVRR